MKYWTYIWLESRKERVHSDGLCEYGRIILKWILRKCIRVDFGYSFFVRTNDLLTNCVMNSKFHKILGNILISWATIGISGNTVYWVCLVLWSVVYCLMLWWSVMYCLVLWWSVMYCLMLWWSVMYCLMLWWSVMYCLVLWWSVMYCFFSEVHYFVSFTQHLN